MPADDLAIRGPHNVVNALAASAAALACGADAPAVRTGLASFSPLEHRVEPCGEIDGVLYVNDSKATNTDAVEKALTAFPGRDVVYSFFWEAMTRARPSRGSRSGSARGSAPPCASARRERFRCALEEADRTGDVDIALADDLRGRRRRGALAGVPWRRRASFPACSSFDEFSGFEERGRAFKAYIEQLRCASGAAARRRPA